MALNRKALPRQLIGESKEPPCGDFTSLPLSYMAWSPKCNWTLACLPPRANVSAQSYTPYPPLRVSVGLGSYDWEMLRKGNPPSPYPQGGNGVRKAREREPSQADSSVPSRDPSWFLFWFLRAQPLTTCKTGKCQAQNPTRPLPSHACPL